MSDEGRLVAGRYRVQRRIGSGAMGVVWECVDEVLDRTVAVKQLLLESGLDPGEAEEARQRARREGRIAARLQHPHAISVYDVTEDEGQPVLVMEYLPSTSLAAKMQEHGPLQPTEVARIGSQAAAALGAAHAAGVVHRDIKPGNILLGDDGTVKITDFGISRAQDDVQVTQTGILAGTPAYLSPDVAKGQEPTPASDVFSLGATLYAAIEGEPPFGLEGNSLALLHAVAAGRVDPPARAGAMTRPLMAMLQDQVEDRPSMAEVTEMLQDVAEGRTDTSPPTPAPTLSAIPAGVTSSSAQSTTAVPAARRNDGPTRGSKQNNWRPLAVSVVGLVAAAVIGALVPAAFSGGQRSGDNRPKQDSTPVPAASQPPVLSTGQEAPPPLSVEQVSIVTTTPGTTVLTTTDTPTATTRPGQLPVPGTTNPVPPTTTLNTTTTETTTPPPTTPSTPAT